MVFRMARPVTRNGTANAAFRRRIPADIKHILSRLPSRYRPTGWGKDEIVISLRTADPKAIPAAHAKVTAEVERHFAGLRAGVRPLSHKDAVALAGEAYRDFQQLDDDPGDAGLWWNRLADNVKAQAGKFSLMIGDEARQRNSMEGHFGLWADHYLAKRGVLTDAEGRWKFIKALAEALNDAYRKLALNAEGDYRPDPAADRFPASPSGSRLSSQPRHQPRQRNPSRQLPSFSRRGDPMPCGSTPRRTRWTATRPAYDHWTSGRPGGLPPRCPRMTSGSGRRREPRRMAFLRRR